VNAPARPPRIAVLGSVNVDIVATGERLPAPGETVSGATLAFHPGGKGANQALAARRLGAQVALVACVGRDANAEAALRLLRADGVDLAGCTTDERLPTGVALIAVARGGENQIVVAPGANRALSPQRAVLPPADALIAQLEVPVETLAAVVPRASGLVCLNLAPAIAVPEELLERADLLVVNETEASFYGERLRRSRGRLALTLGARGARLEEGGRTIATAEPPTVVAVDTTGAGDAFVAALVVALVEGQEPGQALRFACAAGAAAASAPGAQTSLPWRADVEALLRGAAPRPPPRTFASDADVRRVGEGLLARTLPKREWTHEAHLAACIWILRERPDLHPEADLRAIISGYNEATGGVNDDTQGYHETLTQLYVAGARAYVAGLAADAGLVQAVNGLVVSERGRREWPLRFYSRERLFSVAARRGYVAPDLLPIDRA
jgi:ribokinase